MAYRDLTQRFEVRRANLKKRNLRFRLRHLKDQSLNLSSLFQTKQSRAMEKALLQEARGFSALEMGTVETQNEQPEWIRFADETNEAIRLLHVKLEYLQLIHTRRLMIRFDEEEEQQDNEIEQTTDEITSLFHAADRSLKKITSPFIGGEPSASAADRLVRLNTQRSIATRLQEISTQFRRRQHEYLQRLRMQKFGADMFDVHGIDDVTMGERSSMYIDRELETARTTIQARDAEIQQIARSVTTLATVFKEVADMVIDQGTLVDRIDYNMEQVVTRMRSGLKELQHAERFQHNTRSERCIFTLVSLIFLCFIILIIKHY